MENHDQEDNQDHREPENHTYNFKWMLILLLVGILGSFIFASFMR